MKTLSTTQLKALVTINLIGEQIKLKTLIDKGVITQGMFETLRDEYQMIEVYKNKYGEWPILTPKGRMAIKPINDLFSSLDRLIPAVL